MKIFKSCLIFIPVVILIFMLSSCSGGTTGINGTTVSGNNTVTDGTSSPGSTTGTGGTTDEGETVGGETPSSMDNRKWYEYKAEGYSLYSNSATYTNQISKHTGIQLPFFENSDAAGRDLYRLNRSDVDMYPEDGWVLITSDFGTETKAPVMPYFIIYNKATGTLRYIFYNPETAIGYDYAVVMLEQLHGKSAMFSYYDSVKCFTSDYNLDKTLATITNLSHGWNYADFVLSYDPAINTKINLSLYISTYGINKSDIKLDGTVTVEQFMERGQIHTSGTTSLGDLVTSGNKARMFYKSTESFLKFCSDNTGSWYSGILNSVGYGGSPLSDEPVIASIAGIISSGIFGNKKAKPVPISYEDDIRFSGIITSANFIDGFNINVPGAITNSNNPYIMPYYTKPLGVFSIKSKPIINITVQTMRGQEPFTFQYYYNSKVTSIKMKDNSFPEIVFNNIEGYYVDKVELGFVFSNNIVDSTIYDTAYGIYYIIYDSTVWNYFHPDYFQFHKDNEVIFSKINDFIISDYNYTENTIVGTLSNPLVNVFGYVSGPIHREWNILDYSNPSTIAAIKTLGKLIAPEIALKVTLYSVNDTEKKNPIVHLKRVRADYNLYQSNYQVISTVYPCGDILYCGPEDTYGWVTTNLGFFTN